MMSLLQAEDSFQQRPDECNVCLLVYDELDRRPRTLPCGHTYCSQCVAAMLQYSRLTCPSCRTDHWAPQVSHFPINYGMEAVVKVMRTQQAETASQASGKALQATGAKAKQRAAAGLSMNQRAKVKVQKLSLESLETSLQKEVQQLKQYRTKLALSRTEHARLLQELDKVAQQHQASMDLLQEEDVRVEGFVAEGEEAQRELRAAQGQLYQVNTAQEAVTTIDFADHITVKSEEWLQHSRKKIPNATVLHTSLMVREATTAALKVITEEAEATPDQVTSGHSNCTIMEAVESVEEGQVKLVDLHTDRLREKVTAGQVFLTQKYEDGTCYSSKVTSKKRKLYLHALEDESPPLRAIPLQVSNVLRSLNYPDITVFLDLAWPGTSPQRVRIRLAADTPLTRQFVTLCLGHTGLTYCNTTLIKEIMYTDVSIVWGGDIRGQKAAANQILPPIDGNECGDTVDIDPGMVVARTALSNFEKRTQFGIVVSCDHDYDNTPLLYHLGSIDAHGQSIVERATDDNDDLTQVRVVDCGLVF